MKPVFVYGVGQDVRASALAAAIRDILLKSSDGFSWLDKGDTVLLKPALNSSDPYPATTHPLAIEVTSQLLAERGAKIVIGDQSGIEHVLHHPGGVIRGSSRSSYIRSGMGSKDDTRFVSFEEGGWDTGFYHYRSGSTPSWPYGFFISDWARKADHIISLPRLSTHSQAGATLGFKIMVGMLREDSRMEFHANGPYNNVITKAAKGSVLSAKDDHSGTFFEKIVEISDAIKGKLRLTMIVATEAQATFGPDRFGIRLGPLGLGRAYVKKPEPGLVFASVDQVAAEAYALALLKDLKHEVPFLPRMAEHLILFQNANVRDLLTVPVRIHPFIRHAIRIGLGNMPERIEYTDVPYAVQDKINVYFS
ncbi:DUF362 domain-containing protein [Methanoregula sp.]|uniref:DUF362 domain-containing protein n=1 Tax=Methanoregula sp. TaxID=2052170 RepID=UPI003C738B53